MPIDPSAVEALQALSLGFAFAGLVASAFELATDEKASFRLLQTGGAAALASVPVLVFCAPFVILRNTVRGWRFEGRPLYFAIAAAMMAGVWSLMSGRIVLAGAQALAGA
jgi:hypothetical protein